MDQIKIGKFIAECRKNKKITQAQLAEKLNITDRAVSKWETGKGMPDSSIMIELCNELEISVNELLSGERIDMKDYNKKAEENLIELKKLEEKNNKKLLTLELVIGYISTISFLVMIFVAGFAIENFMVKIAVIIIAFILLIVGLIFALKLETEAGYYECKNCNHRYVPKFNSVFFAMHYGRTRYLKCPECGKRTWNKKVLTK